MGFKTIVTLRETVKRTDYRVLVSALYDSLFYGLSVAAGFGIMKLIEIQSGKIPLAGSIDDLSMRAAEQLQNQFAQFYIYASLYVIAGFFLLAVFASVFKGLAWQVMIGQKMTRKQFLQFFKANIAIVIAIMIIGLLVMLLLKQTIVHWYLILVMLLSFFIGSSVYFSIAKDAPSTLRNIFSAAFSNVPKMIGPFLLILFCGLLMVSLLSSVASLEKSYVIIPFLLLYAALSRLYLITSLQSQNKH